MNNADITDPLFREAVAAIDAGNLLLLQQLLHANPNLINKRLDYPTEGYFKHPYLLWFVADNPVRHDKLPANIVNITGFLIHSAKQNAKETFHAQLDYTLGLVATGRIPRESGSQIEMMDLLIDAGAKPGNGHGALAHGNIDAARHLIERGGEITLTIAIALDRVDDVQRLLKEANANDKQIALIASSFLGKTGSIRLLIDSGTNVNANIHQSSGFQSHASALHQAVVSGSLDSVKLLVEAGADLNAEDRIYEGRPLDWARYMETEEKDETKKKKFAEIEAYLLNKISNS